MPTETARRPKRGEALYPCMYPGCRVLRTADEGGRIFTVCDKHWDKKWNKSYKEVNRILKAVKRG